MDGFFTQIVLASRDPDSDDLINILFVVVIGIVYAIGGFIKSKARKANQQQEQPQEANERPQDRWSGHRKTIQKIEERVKRLNMPVELPKEELSAKSEETIAPEPQIKSILNLESSNDLKKAVLYYEILGKPVGFRD